MNETERDARERLAERLGFKIAAEADDAGLPNIYALNLDGSMRHTDDGDLWALWDECLRLSSQETWHKVSEKLPLYDEKFAKRGATPYDVLLVYHGKVLGGHAYAYKDGKVVFSAPSISGDITEEVTHWQPLPPSPTEEPK